MRPTCLLMVALAGCGAASTTDDLSNLTVESGKADAVLPTGAWEISASALRADDLVYFNLLPDGRFVWARCYDTPCSQLVPQDGTWTAYKSKSGHYIKFYMTPHPDTTPRPKTAPPASATPPAPDFAGMYAYTLRGKKLKLRRVYTSRWFTTTRFTDEAACNESGGTWDGSQCACSDPPQPTVLFQPGLGGCFQAPAWSESACDDSGGSYTDDDINLVGSYCDCGIDRYWAEAGGCVDVPQ